MVEKDTVFSSKIKYKGIFNFGEFYKFCYAWLTEETELDLAETKYKEKIAGNAKNVEVVWKGVRKVTDYFKYQVEVKFLIIALTEVEVQKEGAKIKTNSGQVEMNVKGILARDYEGKFEKNATRKFFRGIYEKWVIPTRIEEYEEKLIKDCDEFLNQAKAWLDLEGRK